MVFAFVFYISYGFAYGFGRISQTSRNHAPFIHRNLYFTCCDNNVRNRFPPPLMLSLIYRLIPPLIPAYLLFKMSTGKIILAFRSMHTPNSIMLTLTVMLRLMPTVRHEAADIKDAMRTRGFLGSFTDVIKNPLRTLEYAIVPLTFRLLKVADELSASAIARGIECPCKKESYYAGRITKIDIGIICVVITISIVLIML